MSETLSREVLEAARQALERIAKRKPENAAYWSKFLAPQFVAAGIEYDRRLTNPIRNHVITGDLS